MIAGRALHLSPTLFSPNTAERRQRVRFSMIHPARCQMRSWATQRFAGLAKVINVSSSGALLAIEGLFRVGDKFEISMEWPVRLNGNVRIELVALAAVVRVEPDKIALRFRRHEFRTCKNAA